MPGENFLDLEGGQFSGSPFCRAVGATDTHDFGAAGYCSLRTRAAIEKLYRDGGREQVARLFCGRHPEQDADFVAEYRIVRRLDEA